MKTRTQQAASWPMPMFVAGVVLIFAGPWFSGQRTVGWILLAAGLLPVAVIIAALIVIGVTMTVLGTLDNLERRRTRKRRRAAAHERAAAFDRRR
jgi:hypothetical protein